MLFGWAAHVECCCAGLLLLPNPTPALHCIASLPAYHPCPPPPPRIRHGLSEIVVFRDNLQHKLRALSALPPLVGDDMPLFEHVCATVLQQAHLSPVPLDYQVRLVSEGASMICVCGRGGFYVYGLGGWDLQRLLDSTV